MVGGESHGLRPRSDFRGRVQGGKLERMAKGIPCCESVLERPRVSRVVTLTVWAGFAVACTPFEPGSDELDAEGSELTSAEPGRDWSCLGRIEEAQRNLLPVAPGSERFVHSIQFLSFVTGAVVQGLSVRVCPQRDVECATPLTDFEPVRPDGWIDVVLYSGFSGFLEIRGDAIIPMAFFYPEPITRDREVYASAIGVVERAVLPTLSAAAGAEQESTLGLVVLRTYDCQGESALGVSYDIDKAGTPFYFVAGLPSLTTVETSDSGIGGFFNVAPGVIVASAELGGTGREILKPASMLVRAGWLSYVRFIPFADE
jgi:hypothetical protein